MAEGVISFTEYIRGRMQSLGIEKFHLETYRHHSKQGGVDEVSAHNEFYYLVSRNVPANLIIRSDSHKFSLRDAVAYAGFDIYRIHEFSGRIKFQLIGGPQVDLEFIRVVPEKNYIPN